jgi:hypothetical protein
LIHHGRLELEKKRFADGKCSDAPAQVLSYTWLPIKRISIFKLADVGLVSEALREASKHLKKQTEES